MAKWKSLEEMGRLRRAAREAGRRVVLTNGCFDLLHGGHVHLLRAARALGDELIVAVNDDASIRRLKGPKRPVFPLRERLEVLSALEPVDYLTVFSQDTPLGVIEALLPDVLVKGGDWSPDAVVGRAEVEAAGGRVEIVPYLEGLSSSEMIERIRAWAAGGVSPGALPKTGRSRFPDNKKARRFS